MRVLFIRHAKALSRSEWREDDLLRPLSEEGREKADRFFQKLPKIYPIECIITSKATRALQTAQILKEHYPSAKYHETDRLNPGADSEAFETVIKQFHSYSDIAIIGHEPDLSMAIGALIGCEYPDIKLKKASVAELRGEGEDFELLSLLYPKLLRNL